MEQEEEDDPDMSHGDQSDYEEDNEETFEDLDVELEELLWDMERLNEVDQDLDEDEEPPVTVSQPASTEPPKV
ncbi:hypothetical protein OESDEN_24290 [Oesophagostomum dentatum]|uniref:Uncharacterized protein n=1 Tax=Oesophagostomum dentatum TaxID=61180 RepID=A0A0B1RWT1_OESDE|nr:hypothetical protein OESDEN_24290 [Oesophagostomum dentatum]